MYNFDIVIRVRDGQITAGVQPHDGSEPPSAVHVLHAVACLLAQQTTPVPVPSPESPNIEANPEA